MSPPSDGVPSQTSSPPDLCTTSGPLLPVRMQGYPESLGAQLAVLQQLAFPAI